MHRDLYMEALRRISELELDESSLQNLIECMQDLRMTMVRSQTVTRITCNASKFIQIILCSDFLQRYMKIFFRNTLQTKFDFMCFSPQQTSLSCDTDAALSNMKQMVDIVRDDQQSLVSQVCKRMSYLYHVPQMHPLMRLPSKCRLGDVCFCRV